jgi:spore coat polysaccharide biosynthesis protein SpsF
MKLGKVGVVVAARTSSTRLPGKALLPLQGLPMLTFLLRRLRGLQSGEVFLATTDLPVDDELATLAAREKVGVFRGSESDLVARYVGAAKQFSLDTVARVTADCPFVDAELVDWCVARAAGFDHFDLATTKGRFPVGLDVEIYAAGKMAALNASVELSPAEREHLTLYFYDHGDESLIRPIEQPDDLAATARKFTVDTAEDYSYARSLADRFDTPEFPIRELLKVAAS